MSSIITRMKDCYGLKQEQKNLKKILGVQKVKSKELKDVVYVPPVRKRISRSDVRYRQPCNLPCVTGKTVLTKKDKYAQEMVEFEGTAKITLVNPTPFDSYRAQRIVAALSALSIIMMGMFLMILLCVVLQYKFYYMINIHIIACAFGFHMMIPIAYMMQEKYAMPGAYFQDQGRRCQAVLLRVIGLSWAGMSYYVLFMDSIYMVSDFNTVHGITGYIAILLAIAELFIQLYPQLHKWPKVKKHVLSIQSAFKILCLLFATLSFAFVITRPKVNALLPNKYLDVLLIGLAEYISFMANLGCELKWISPLYDYLRFLYIRKANKERPPCARAIPV